MTYDLHGDWENKLGHHTAMVGNDKLTIPDAINYWVTKGKHAYIKSIISAPYTR